MGGQEVGKLTMTKKKGGKYPGELERDASLLRDVFESVQDGISVLDTDFTILQVNPVMEEWYADTMPLVGKKCYRAYHHRDRPCQNCPTVRCLKSGHTERGVFPGLPGSSISWVELFSYPIKNEDGEVTGVVEFVRDITERKKAETALLKSEQRSRALLSAIPDLLFEFDRAGTIISYKGRQQDLYSAPSEFVGKRIEDVLPRQLAKKTKTAIDNALISEEVQRFEYHLPIRGKQHFYEARLAPSGKDTVLALVRDITERSIMDRKLQESEQKFRMLAENVPGVIYLCHNDPRYTMLYLNDAVETLTGYPKEDFLADHISFVDLYHPDDAAWIPEAVDRAIARRDPFHLTYRLRHRSGEWRWIDEFGCGVYRDGELLYLEGFLIDVTERKRAESSLAQLNELLRLINKIMRHDILNDLQIARSAMDLYEELADDALYRKAMGRMEQGIALIKRMRELESLLVAGGTLQEHSLREAILEVAGRHAIDCTVEGDCIVLADDALYSVVDNLLVNAVEHGKATAMSVSITRDGGNCRVCFADNGKGVPGHVRDRVFEERFSYGESGGTGLGLYIVKKTVERYGGTVEVRDNRPRGAAFVLVLPASVHSEK
ncbi:MAG: PAS domain-containing protein [Candidatus Thermoplasmatota archaeon]|nr:PAS domain-containing protein [Candidatus Thermoplasmatota archaeon]